MGQNWFTSLLQPPFSPTDHELLEDKVWVYNYVNQESGSDWLRAMFYEGTA